ncbi:MAG TPA: hypothetical protein VGO93_24465 [Candidatus Xenobia bacterium]
MSIVDALFKAPAAVRPPDLSAPLAPDRAFVLSRIVRDSAQDPIRYVRQWRVESEGG